MQLTVTDDAAAMSALAADRIIQTITATPDAALLVATGSSPLGAFEIVARRARVEGIKTARLRIFQLDEYLNLAAGDRRLLYGWMQRAVLDPLAIPEANVVRLPSIVADEARVRRDYEAAVAAAGGFDLAILGLGPNGHLGFNEPPSGPEAPTRVVELTLESVVSNSTYWGGPDQTPRQAITAGLDLILAARRILLIVPGTHKRAILHLAVSGPETPEVPASYLRRCAGEIICDRAAWGAGPPGATN
ncbi:MAG: glucosamine-6-phosphate deaminase [Chloroflexota bacterium]|nr:glucosamine-6-phosphate deaminase [Chloroflexota bacterium]